MVELVLILLRLREFCIYHEYSSIPLRNFQFGRELTDYYYYTEHLIDRFGCPSVSVLYNICIKIDKQNRTPLQMIAINH